MATKTNVDHREVVQALIKAKAVDFDAIGKTFAQIGPELSLADEPWENFCGTMRGFIRVYVIGPYLHQGIGSLESLGSLRELAGALKD